MFSIADLLGWFSDAGAWLADNISPTAWAIAVVIALGIAVGFAIRKARLWWLGRSPRVQITEFAWTGEKDDDRDGVWFTSRFREQLGKLQTHPLDPLPERSPSTPLVNVVEGVSQGVSGKADVGRAFGRLFSAIWPAATYEVWGTLRPLQDGGCRVSVQLIDRARGNRSLVSESLRGATWQESARQAAMAVAGGLYPRVRRRHRGPWARWTKSVPRLLVSDFHDAQRLDDENRLAEALDKYHGALARDPLNPEMRLKIAMLQERLAIDLDAWVTYLAIVTETDRKTWTGSERHTRFVALYRLAVLLANGRVARQWLKDVDPKDPPTERDEERWKLRYELMASLESDPWLMGELSRTVGVGIMRRRGDEVSRVPAAQLLHWIPGYPRQMSERDERRRWLRALFLTVPFSGGETKGEETRAERIEDVLQVMALRRLEELDDWLRAVPPLRSAWRWHRRQWRDWRLHRPPFRQWFRRRDLSRCVIRVSKRLARINIAANVERRQAQDGDETAVERTRDQHRKLTRAWPFPAAGRWRWPLPPEGPGRWLARWLAPRRRWANGRSDSWQLHYNAACAVAAPLIDRSVLRNARKQNEEKRVLPVGVTQKCIVQRAVGELEEYAHRAGSEQVANQAEWVALDDPDLRGLHSHDAFRVWASHHLPLELPEQRPERSVNIERYTAKMLKEAARVFALTWRERANGGKPSPHEVAAWWRTERDAWTRVAKVCREHRSWRQRFEALQALQRWLRAQEKEGLIDFGHEKRDRTPESAEAAGELFDQLTIVIGGTAARRNRNGMQPKSALRWAELRCESAELACDGGSRVMGRKAIAGRPRRLHALRAARLWTRLADVLKEELDQAPGGIPTADPWRRLRPVRRELPASIAWLFTSPRGRPGGQTAR